eukprot:1676033-Pyramimonas_sp.AAC.2
MQRSNLWSMSLSREQLPEEAVEAQGMALFSSADASYQCPFKEAVLRDEFRPRQLRSMGGNSMHVAAVGACLPLLKSKDPTIANGMGPDWYVDPVRIKRNLATRALSTPPCSPD